MALTVGAYNASNLLAVFDEEKAGRILRSSAGIALAILVCLGATRVQANLLPGNPTRCVQALRNHSLPQCSDLDSSDAVLAAPLFGFLPPEPRIAQRLTALQCYTSERAGCFDLQNRPPPTL